MNANLQQFIQNQNRIDLVPRLKRDYLMDNWEAVGKTFKHNYKVDNLAIQFINFFCKEREIYFPELKLNPKKGLCVHGGIGLGKTLNFRIYQTILILERDKLAKHVIDKKCNKAYSTPAFFYLEEVKDTEIKYKKKSVEHYEFLTAKPELVLDDVGTEAINNKEYGTDKDLVSDIIRLRYNQMHKGFFVTHITTNLIANETENQIKDRYGPRVTDRMNEMFIYILATGESKRS